MSSSSDRMEFLTTTKGKTCLIWDGHQYCKNYCDHWNVTTWRCRKQKTEGCRGIIKTSPKGDAIFSVEHSCEREKEVDLEVKKACLRARKKVAETDAPIIEIYKAEVQPLMHRGAEFVANLPKISQFAKSSQGIRRKLRRKYAAGENMSKIIFNCIMINEPADISNQGQT